MFQYVMFRSAMAVVFSLLIGIFVGKKIIGKLQQKQIGETIRNLDLEGQYSKRGNNYHGRSNYYSFHSCLYPALRKVGNIYIILMLVSTVWLGMHGFADDISRCSKRIKRD